MGDVHTDGPELEIEARDFLQPRLDEANVGDLTAEVEMNQLQDADLSERLQFIDELDELGRAESELALLAATLCPPAGPFAGELDAHAAGRRHAEFFGDFEQHVELADLLEHDEHLVSELLPHEGQPHELMVLVAVADDEMLGAL